MSTILQYVFANGDVVQIEVEDSFATVIHADRRKEQSYARKVRRHEARLENFSYEDRKYFSDEDSPERLLIRKEENEAISEEIENMSTVHKRRLLMYLDGLTYEEIAKRENVTVGAVAYSMKAARKKIKELL